MMGALKRTTFLFAAAVAAAGSLLAPAGAAEAAPIPTSTGWALIADDSTHMMTVWHGDQVVRTMPISMGRAKYPTPYGTYHTMEKYRHIIMDSSTVGIPVNSPDGYIDHVNYAIRLTNSGIFVHAAPWSVASQGKRNVSHGCINISTDNARFLYNNLPMGTPILVER
jgi:lipoprotein-anchoring transpeptidase ErfK/SrfK